jgi:predicted amidohydrolase YtcJ
MHATGDRACRAALQALEGLPREEVRAETINNRRLLTVLTKLHLSKLAL